MSDIKFADDITASSPAKSGLDSASAEAEGIQNWSETNQMTLNLSKTWEMVQYRVGLRNPLNKRVGYSKIIGYHFSG